MPCHATQTAPHFVALPHIKNGFRFQELLGHAEKENPASFGVFVLDQGHPLSYDKFPYHMFFTITEGEVIFEDRDKPESLHLKAGDIAHVAPDTSIRWSSPTSCKGTYIHLKPLGDHEYISGIY
ncbi:hypothetical protein F5I97DRAFT_266718 [Phlebopus sp. FC_14]|nr:hypothetical protein F5I97DRAFT_266718 [Phlebopus sp. FC_14]